MVADLRGKTFHNWEKFVKLYRQGRANGSGAETAAEIRERFGNEPIVHTIDEIDHLVSQDEIVLENMDNYANAGHDGRTNLLDAGESSSKRMKGKNKFSREDEVLMMKEGLDNVANAIKICAVEIGKLNQKPTSESENWKLLGELGIQGGALGRAYLFLMKNHDML